MLQEHHLGNGYQLLYTPHVAKADMWKTSGHLDFYSENMYDRIKVMLFSVTYKNADCWCTPERSEQRRLVVNYSGMLRIRWKLL